MARVVMKFGGTSVSNIERIKNVAQRVKRVADSGHQIAVVISAMAGTTNKLLDQCQAIIGSKQEQETFDKEYDTVIATGEQVTTGLLSLALQALQLPACSWQGWQVPIQTTNVHRKARIKSINSARLAAAMNLGEIPVIAGFQGISTVNNRVTTLGRGGSDTSAVALAAALKAECCEIYTDVDGVYTSDPRIVTRARKLDKISYEEMLEMASLGAKVLQTRAVEMAMKHHVPLKVLSSFVDVPGTLVCDEDEIVERHMVSGITYSRDEAKITLIRVSDKPGIAASVFGPLADANVNVDMIVQDVSEDGNTTNITFTVTKADLERAIRVIQSSQDLVFGSLASDANVVKISVVGVGMRSHTGIASIMFRTLAERGINIQVISTSEIKISVLVSDEYAELALRALHSAYGLDVVNL